MADTAKSVILSRLTAEGYSASYGTLLFQAALVGTDAETLKPENDEERHEWRGHLFGLRAALMCVAMYETKLGPESAAVTVRKHLEDAARDLARPGGAR